jgi:mannose-6-phosphate isomerase-like protein (cupin superfamily)
MTDVIHLSDLPGKLAARFDGHEHDASVSLFVGTWPPDTGPGPHFHPYDETFVIESGEATFTVDGAEVVAKAGDIVVVPAEAVHSFVSSGAEEMRQVSVHPRARMETTFVDED